MGNALRRGEPEHQLPSYAHFLIIIKLEPTLMETLNLSIGEHLDKSTLDRHGVDVPGLSILAEATILW